MAAKCEFVHPDGRKCGAFSIKGEGLCIFHCDRRVVVSKVFDEEWNRVRRIRLLSKRLSALKSIKDEAVRARLTLDLLKALDALESKVRSPEPEAENTTEKKLAEWEKSQR